MRNDAAGPAPEIPERSIAPDILFRVLGVALDGHRTQFVIGPDPTRAPTQRAIAARRRFGRCRQRKAHRSAVAGAVQRWRWLFVSHGMYRWLLCCLTLEAAPSASAGIIVGTRVSRTLGYAPLEPTRHRRDHRSPPLRQRCSEDKLPFDQDCRLSTA